MLQVGVHKPVLGLEGFWLILSMGCCLAGPRRCHGAPPKVDVCAFACQGSFLNCTISAEEESGGRGPMTLDFSVLHSDLCLDGAYTIDVVAYLAWLASP